MEFSNAHYVFLFNVFVTIYPNAMLIEIINGLHGKESGWFCAQHAIKTEKQ